MSEISNADSPVWDEEEVKGKAAYAEIAAQLKFINQLTFIQRGTAQARNEVYEAYGPLIEFFREKM